MAIDTAPAPRANLIDGVVVVVVAGQEHAVLARHVREVTRMVALTPLPDGPAWLAGIVNLRGVIAPVVDLNTYVGLVAPDYALSTPLLVVEAASSPLVLVVDAVVELLTDSIHLAAEGGVVGTVRAGTRLMPLVDVEEIGRCVERTRQRRV